MDSVQAFEVCGPGSNPGGGTFLTKTRPMKFSIINFQFSKLLWAIVLAFLFFSLLPGYAEAGLVPCGRSIDDPNTRDINETDSCELCDLFILLNNIFTYFFKFILPTVATGLMAWGGFTLLTAGENKNKFEEAKAIITAAVIGLVIILVSWIFLNMFLSSIGVAEWTGLGSWWKVECP